MSVCVYVRMCTVRVWWGGTQAERNGHVCAKYVCWRAQCVVPRLPASIPPPPLPSAAASTATRRPQGLPANERVAAFIGVVTRPDGLRGLVMARYSNNLHRLFTTRDPRLNARARFIAAWQMAEVGPGAGAGAGSCWGLLARGTAGEKGVLGRRGLQAAPCHMLMYGAGHGS